MNIIGFSSKNTEISADGKMSPHNMITTTFGDELKIFNDESKVIGISLKERFILALVIQLNADWLGNNGKWITSSFTCNLYHFMFKKSTKRNDVQKY